MEEYIGLIQWILFGVFLITGLLKTFLPKEKLVATAGPSVGELTTTQIKLAGITEIMGAIGVILPVKLDIYPILTPLAASGLALAMLVALSLNVEHKQYKKVALNIVLLAMAFTVATYYF